MLWKEVLDVYVLLTFKLTSYGLKYSIYNFTIFSYLWCTCDNNTVDVFIKTKQEKGQSSERNKSFRRFSPSCPWPQMGNDVYRTKRGACPIKTWKMESYHPNPPHPLSNFEDSVMWIVLMHTYPNMHACAYAHTCTQQSVKWASVLNLWSMRVGLCWCRKINSRDSGLI